MVMAAAKVSLGNWSHTVGTIAELDSSIAAGKVGADKILSVLGIFGNNKVGRLY
jgi:hypothetical protein